MERRSRAIPSNATVLKRRRTHTPVRVLIEAHVGARTRSKDAKADGEVDNLYYRHCDNRDVLISDSVDIVVLP
jgi:hypothetical protein